MKAKSNVLYNSLREDVMKTLSARTGLSEEVLIANEIRKLDKNHPEKKHTVDEAIDELVARSCEDMLSNSNEARKLLNKMSVSEQKRFMKKVQDTFDNLIQWVNDLLSLYKSDSYEAKLLREYKHDLKRISKQWDAMFAEAIKNNQVLEKSGTFGHKSADGDVVYALREEAITEVEQAISNKNYDKEIKLTESSPYILTSQKGVRNLPNSRPKQKNHG